MRNEAEEPSLSVSASKKRSKVKKGRKGGHGGEFRQDKAEQFCMGNTY
jgi:hypothetical protein